LNNPSARLARADHAFPRRVGGTSRVRQWVTVCGESESREGMLRDLVASWYPALVMSESHAADETVESPVTRLGHANPESIGPFRILERIGEGGMGVIYKAEQRSAVRRVVALKVIKLGMDTKEVLARFEAERQALALMSHPNIARVLDAGATESGRPYFAMEFVPGVALTKYCDDQRLPTRQRLELFYQVCQAIQHAHQKGIIHRDLKPSNILL